MRAGSKVRIKPEAWANRQTQHGTDEPCPDEVEIVHVAGDRTSLAGYVWLGVDLGWWEIEDLI